MRANFSSSGRANERAPRFSLCFRQRMRSDLPGGQLWFVVVNATASPSNFSGSERVPDSGIIDARRGLPLNTTVDRSLKETIF